MPEAAVVRHVGRRLLGDEGVEEGRGPLQGCPPTEKASEADQKMLVCRSFRRYTTYYHPYV